MLLSDARAGPLAAPSKTRPDVEVLLVDGDLAPLQSGATLPALPPSFKGAIGEKLDLVIGKRRVVVVVGCGKLADAEQVSRFWEAAGAATVEALRALKVEVAALAAPIDGTDPDMAVHYFTLGATLASYRCAAYRRKPAKAPTEVKELQLPASQWKASARARALADAVNWTRALVDAPSNVMTPQAFAAAAQDLKRFGVRVKILDRRALERIGAGGLLAVGRSSEHPPLLLVCEWQGRRSKEIDLALVGKGLTFDAGGLNLKPRPGIEKMKLDMAGAAGVVGAMRVLAQRRAPLNVVAVMPLCENVIDGSSYRPGDVITSLSGLTIEVDNTDAEGRIVLADAMTYAIETYAPRQLVDLATLTGAITIALLEKFAGLFTADDGIAASLQAAADRSGESIWRMPLVKRQDYVVDSDIADVKNVGYPGTFGGGMGSSIAGAKFLEKFAGKTPWAHLDIAGVATASRPMAGVQKGATGYGVRLLDAYADLVVNK